MGGLIFGLVALGLFVCAVLGVLGAKEDEGKGEQGSGGVVEAIVGADGNRSGDRLPGGVREDGAAGTSGFGRDVGGGFAEGEGAGGEIGVGLSAGAAECAVQGGSDREFTVTGVGGMVTDEQVGV